MRRLLLSIIAVGVFGAAPLVFAACNQGYSCACDGTTYPSISSQMANSLEVAAASEVCTIACTNLDAKETWTLSCGTTPANQGQISAEASLEQERTDIATPNLSIPLPGLKFTQPYEKDGYLYVPYLAQYVQVIFSLAIVVASIGIILTIMISGLKWMAARGNPSIVKNAQGDISKAFTSLIILLLVVSIVTIIDPTLAQLPNIKIKKIDFVRYIDESGDASGSLAFDKSTAPVQCDPSLELYDIAMSFKGNVCYRFGAKGGPAPYSKEKNKDASGRPYSEYCPPGKICSDCSGFVDILRTCKGLAPAGETGGTAGIFSGAEKVTECSPGKVLGTTVNGVYLEPGDLLGWPTKTENGEIVEVGHVFMYIGKGLVADSHGGPSGRDCNAVEPKSTAFVCEGYQNTSHGLYIVRRSK